MDPHKDYEARSWAVDYAIQLNGVGQNIDRVLEDAQKIYGFMFPENGKIETLHPKEEGADYTEQESVSSQVKEPEPIEAKEEKDEVRDPAKCLKDQYGHTERQRKALEIIIDQASIGQKTTRKQIGDILGVTPTSIKFTVEPLIKKGFIKEIKEARYFAYCPLKNIDGTPCTNQKKGDVVTENGVAITKCPPAYATGYGFDKSVYEEL